MLTRSNLAMLRVLRMINEAPVVRLGQGDYAREFVPSPSESGRLVECAPEGFPHARGGEPVPGTRDRPTLPAYTTQDSYELWEFRNDTWHSVAVRHTREDAVLLAESRGYPFWAVIRCSRRVEVNTVED